LQAFAQSSFRLAIRVFALQTQTMQLEFFPIQASELEVFAKIIQAVNHDLEQPLWAPDQLEPERLLRDYGLCSMYLARFQAEAVATFVIIESDPRFWPDTPEGESLFIHKIAVTRAWKGHRLSSQILDFAVNQGLERGKKYLRLDTDISRPVLCQLYETYGFDRVGQRTIGTFECALYELEVRPR
jgi:GNAT superfamily N-acetyltransferase